MTDPLPRTKNMDEAVLTFQERVQPWMMACFGYCISRDTVERNHRFLEEALELVQATGCTQIEAHQLVDYVFARQVGEPNQEVGGVMVTLAALCLANDLDMHAAAETELARIWTKVDVIRAKQAAKPKHSPLPGSVESPQRAEAGMDMGKGWRVEVSRWGELVVAIEESMLAGRDLSEEDETLIRGCAKHLDSFVFRPQRSDGEKHNGDTSGAPIPAQCESPPNEGLEYVAGYLEGFLEDFAEFHPDADLRIAQQLKLLLGDVNRMMNTGTAAEPGVQNELTQKSAQMSDGIKET